MITRAAEELYYDSEATLRLVDNVLEELQVMDEVGPPDEIGRFSQRMVRQAEHAGDLPPVVARAYSEVQDLLEGLRRSRDVLERTSAEKAHHSSDRLDESERPAESSATDLLDGVDRALEIVDRLDGADDADSRGALQGQLRRQLFDLMGALQFQDITTQQISYAASVLAETESRLDKLSELFDPARFGETHRWSSDHEVVDDIFGG